MTIAPNRTLAATVLVIAAAGTAALAGPAGAATKASAKVTIQTEEDGFSGFVTSKRRSCASGRKVTLYRQAGSKRSARRDKKVDSDIAQPNGDGSQWKIDVEDDGRYYASVKSTRKCKTATSRTLRIELKPADE